jgi:hypothetical protein
MLHGKDPSSHDLIHAVTESQNRFVKRQMKLLSREDDRGMIASGEVSINNYCPSPIKTSKDRIHASSPLSLVSSPTSPHFKSPALNIEVQMREKLQALSLATSYKEESLVAHDRFKIICDTLDTMIDNNQQWPYVALLRKIKIEYEKLFYIKSIAVQIINERSDGEDENVGAALLGVTPEQLRQQELEKLNDKEEALLQRRKNEDLLSKINELAEERDKQRLAIFKLKEEMKKQENVISKLSERALDSNPAILKHRQLLAVHGGDSKSHGDGTSDISKRGDTENKFLQEEIASLRAKVGDLEVENAYLKAEISKGSQAQVNEEVTDIVATLSDPNFEDGGKDDLISGHSDDEDDDDDMCLFSSDPTGPVKPNKIIPKIALSTLSSKGIHPYQDEFMSQADDFSESWREEIGNMPTEAGAL